MLSRHALLIVGVIVFTGCTTARNVAVTSFRVLDTPARFVRDRIDPPQTSTTTTTTTESYGTSDVANPGRPVTAPAQESRRSRERATATESSDNLRRPTPSPRNEATVQRKPAPSAAPRSAATQAPQFPTARAVPGKPGYVYSVDPKGGIIDVTGYKSGDKAKDPYTQQVFIVP